MLSLMEFYWLAPGARFEYEGKLHQKAAMSVALDDAGKGNVSGRHSK
jgi:hypothetical protein